MPSVLPDMNRVRAGDLGKAGGLDPRSSQQWLQNLLLGWTRELADVMCSDERASGKYSRLMAWAKNSGAVGWESMSADELIEHLRSVDLLERFYEAFPEYRE